MKKSTLIALFTAAIVFLGASQVVWGQLLLTENFEYTAGTDLSGQGSWVNIGTNNTQNLNVSSSGLTFTGYSGSGVGNAATLLGITGADDLGKGFTSQNSGVIYYTFMVSVANTATTGGYITSLNTAANATNYTGRIFVKVASGNLNFGLSKGSETVTYSTTNFTPTTTYVVVLKYEFIAGTTNDKVSLFVFPSTLPVSEPVTPEIGPLTPTNADQTALAAVLLRQDASVISTVSIDGLRIGNTWADVLPATGTTAPIVTSPTATGITNTTAILGGNITSDGGSTITERGTVWKTTTGVSITDNKLSDGLTATGVFSHTRSSLPVGTQIFYRAYAINGIGTTLSSESSFYTISNEPSGHASAFSATPVSQTQIDLTFSAPSSIPASGYLILQRATAAPTGAPVDGTGYSVGNAIGDGSVAAIVSNPADVAASITSLSAGTHYYFKLFPYNWDGAVAATYNYKTDGSVPVADATTSLPFDVNSYVSAPVSQANPLLVSSLVDTDPEAIDVFRFKINDVGADALKTKVTQVTIAAGANNTANWVNTIQAVKLSVDGGATFVVTGTPVISAASIVFPITSGNLDVTNGTNVTVSLYLYLKASGLTDNQVMEFTIPAAAHGFTADATGSTFLTTFVSSTTSNQMLVDVVSTKLKYIQQPTSAVPNAIMTPVVTIEATDANNNRDLDKAGSVSLASSGTMTGPVTATLAAGTGTFGDIVHTATGFGLTLTASYSGLTDAVSNTFNISLPATLTELVVPQYMGSKTAGSANNARTSIAICVKIDNLLPSTSYDLKLGLALTSEAATSFGAGNTWKPVDGYSGTNTSTIPNAFLTDATGSSGVVWVIFQPTGNASRFGGGAVHNIRVGYAVNGSTMASAPKFVGTKTITTLDIATTALTPATTDDGAFIKGSADPTVTGKYVLLYDNVSGTGDPLFSYQVRQATATSLAQTELPAALSDIYLQAGTSAAGDYPAVIPINYANGVRRVESRNADNTFSFANTDDDGVWPSGVNTTTLARRDVGVITVTDAPLIATTKTLNLSVILEGLSDGAGGMREVWDENQIPVYGAGIADLIGVSLRSTVDGSVVYALPGGVELPISGNVDITIPSTYGGTYYIVIENRNHIQTWSASGGVDFSGSSITYNFTDSDLKAFGSNLKLLGDLKYAIYAGDITVDGNQDGYVDGSDLDAVFNESSLGSFQGYRPTNVTGDDWVDGSDLDAVFNNSSVGIQVQNPFAKK